MHPSQKKRKPKKDPNEGNVPLADPMEKNQSRDAEKAGQLERTVAYISDESDTKYRTLTGSDLAQ
jgi:hypothetical protein